MKLLVLSICLLIGELNYGLVFFICSCQSFKLQLFVISHRVYLGVTQNCLATVSGRGPGGPGGEPPVFDCSGKVGYYADLWKNCEVYYQCLEDGTKLT